jgi:hypothetical protein
MKVADMTLMPAMPGTITSRFLWSPANTAPKMASSSSGSSTPKNAALGLRQNILRSSRNCRHAAPHQPGAAAGERDGNVSSVVVTPPPP